MIYKDPQKIIDKFYEDDGRRLLKKKKTMRKVRAKHYTNFNYSSEGENDKTEK